MANPFDFAGTPIVSQDPLTMAIRRVLGTGGAISGSGAMPSPASAPQAPAAQSMPVASSGPSQGFLGNMTSRLGASDGPLARAGWIGALLTGGNPTTGEMQAQRGAGAASIAVQKVQQAIQSGTNPQRAIVDFMQTPEGMQFMATGGDLKQLAQLVTPPSPENVVLSPGQTAFNRDPITGAMTQSAAVQPTDIQSFNALADIGKLSDDERAALATAQLAKTQGGDPTQAEAAVTRLVQSGKIDRQTGDLLLAGALETIPVLDAAAKRVGDVVIDKTSNRAFQLPNNPTAQGDLPQPGTPDYAEGVTPGTKPEDVAGQSNASLYQGMDDPSEIVEGAGPIGWFMSKLSGLGVLDPALVPENTNRQRRALAIIQSDAQQLARDSGGKLLAQQVKIIDKITDNLGIGTSPLDTANALIQLHDMYDNRQAVDEQILNDKNTTAENRGNAAVDLAGIKRAKANLPSRESLTARAAKLRTEQPLERVTNNLEEGENRAAKTLDAADEAVAGNGAKTQTFESTDAAMEAWKAGKLKKGDKFVVGNKRYNVDFNNGE